MNDAEHFEKHGCLFVKNFIDAKTVSIVSRYFENKLRRGEWVEGVEDDMPVSKYFYYADPLIEVLLQENKTVVENAVGKELTPTYSYSRILPTGRRTFAAH